MSMSRCDGMVLLVLFHGESVCSDCGEKKDRSTGGPLKLLALSTVDCIYVIMDSFCNGTRGRPYRGRTSASDREESFGGLPKQEWYMDSVG
ncbi:hypothetical protein ANN_13187 [Periplaneta americana]|uniref:Secreted protein n=1 Tax=Periplaneta americana TaxID=6978 RepID=A0ABQ8TKQ3_PERAM|nr:hypothetical protein ANN_13187 [Periplaneta americana]